MVQQQLRDLLPAGGSPFILYYKQNWVLAYNMQIFLLTARKQSVNTSFKARFICQEMKTTVKSGVVSNLAAQANGILYCPSLLQAVLAFFSTFCAI